MQRTIPLLAIVATLLLVTVALAAGAVVTLQAPPGAVNAGSEFTTDVTIQGAEAVLGFQFDIVYDANLVELAGFDLGPWLASSGRSPSKLGPAPAKEGGRVTIGAYTLGQQAGAGGDGLMATLRWKAKANGAVTLQLQKLQLAGSGGTSLPGSISSEAVSVTIGGAAATATPAAGNQSVLLGAGLAVLVVVALVVLLRRRASNA